MSKRCAKTTSKIRVGIQPNKNKALLFIYIFRDFSLKIKNTSIDGYIFFPKNKKFIRNADFQINPIFKLKFIDTIDVFIGPGGNVYYNALKKDINLEYDFIIDNDNTSVRKMCNTAMLKVSPERLKLYENKIVECFLSTETYENMWGTSQYLIPYSIRYDKTIYEANFEKVFFDFINKTTLTVREFNLKYNFNFPDAM